jgi:hypothetical protein
MSARIDDKWVNTLLELDRDDPLNSTDGLGLFNKAKVDRHLDCTSLRGAKARLAQFKKDAKRLRTKTIESWSKADKSVASISSHIHVGLLEHYLQFSKSYPDQDLPSNILKGFDLVGTIKKTGLWSPTRYECP